MVIPFPMLAVVVALTPFNEDIMEPPRKRLLVRRDIDSDALRPAKRGVKPVLLLSDTLLEDWDWAALRVDMAPGTSSE